MENKFEKKPVSSLEERPDSEAENLLETQETQEASHSEEQKKILADIENDQSELIARAENIKDPSNHPELSEEKIADIYERGGFADRVKQIKEKIKTLTKDTKGKIRKLFSSKEDIQDLHEKREKVPEIEDFSDLLHRRDEIIEDLFPEQRKEVEQEIRDISIIADVASEITRETYGIDPTSSCVEESETKEVLREIVDSESILEKENPFEYMAAVRLTDDLPVFEDGKMILNTPCRISPPRP